MRSEKITNILKKIPLETRIKTTIEAFFIAEFGGTFFVPIDEDGNELLEAVEANNKCFKKAEPLVKNVLKEIEDWKKDGCP